MFAINFHRLDEWQRLMQQQFWNGSTSEYLTLLKIFYLYSFYIPKYSFMLKSKRLSNQFFIKRQIFYKFLIHISQL